MLLFLLAACGNKEDNSSNENNNTETNEVVENNSENTEGTDNLDQDTENEEESESVSFEVQDTNGPEDQGDLNVWFKGDFEIVDHMIHVKGTTNLLPKSRLYLKTDSEDSVIIGGNGSGIVEDSGAFELEAGIPDGFEGILHIELSFAAGTQREEIVDHYMDGITGNFARIYYDSYNDQVFSKAAFNKTIVFDGSDQSFSIEEPEWNFPSDLGDTNIWIKPTIEKLEDYVVVNVESNLVEETFIRAVARIPNYITTGFSGSAYVNPDGSATMYIKDPEKDSRIKDLTEYDIVIEVDPSDLNNGKHVIEAYGEVGENLSGDLVVEEDGEKYIEQTITITVE